MVRTKLDIGVIGECMLELRQDAGGSYQMSYGGDAFNTAVYAHRAGLSVGFLTATGDDYYSDWLLARWQDEGMDCRDARRLADSAPALYVIRNDDEGERYFHYWRDASPFRQWLVGMDAEALQSTLVGYEVIYLTGIGLALLPSEDRERLLAALERYRAAGGQVAFDPNYRPILWRDAAIARQWIDRGYSVSTLAMPSLEDEVALGADSIDRVIDHALGLGVEELVVKDGASGCTVARSAGRRNYPIAQPVRPVDTTAAGDSFNAAYLACWIAGETEAQAVAAAQKLSAQVVCVRGAISPVEEIQ
ncbi:MAG: sugar kinase [Pseudomonadaceae bacterium]|nr:sugar kinase [Pseudomonadaceae bacterium]